MRNIRASMIPSYPDCPRRAAARQWPELPASIGITLRELAPSIGALVGTSAHVGSIGLINRETDTIEKSIEKLREISANGANYDTTTGNLNHAEHQVITLVSSFERQILSTITDVICTEQKREANALGFFISGSSDIETVAAIPDLKFGKSCKPYHGQIGTYSLTRTANGVNPATEAYIIWGQRTPVKKTFQGFQVINYDIRLCEKIAWATMQHIKTHIDAWDKTGNPMSFPANPMSMMCTDKYCPAWGTRWCEYGN